MNRSRGFLTILAASALIGCSDEAELRETYALLSIDGDPVPVDLPISGLYDSLTIVEGGLAITADSVVATELWEVVDSAGHQSDFFIRHASAYSIEGDRLVLHPVLPDPPSPGSCASAPVYRIEDDGRRLRSVGATIVGDCVQPPDAGIDPPVFIYRAIG